LPGPHRRTIHGAAKNARADRGQFGRKTANRAESTVRSALVPRDHPVFVAGQWRVAVQNGSASTPNQRAFSR